MNDHFARYIEKQEDALIAELNAGLITKRDFNEAMRALRQEEQDAYAADLDQARDEVNDRWGYR